MSRITVRAGGTVSLVGLIMATLVGAAPRVRAEDARVVIRLYDAARIDLPARATATRDAASILGRAGVVSEWRDCSRDGADFPCRSVRHASDLVIRILPTSRSRPESSDSAVSAQEPSGESNLQLGFAAVDPSGRANVMATVYRDRVLTVARRASVDYGELLGRAMAHEIGHLLLRLPGHGLTGLMRGIWTDAELIQNRHGDWTFTESEALRMHSILTHTAHDERGTDETEAALPPPDSLSSGAR